MAGKGEPPMKWKNAKPKTRLPVPEFRRICGREHVLTAPEDLVAYSFDASKLSALPEAVILPGSAA